jgi:hypothetical protein
MPRGKKVQVRNVPYLIQELPKSRIAEIWNTKLGKKASGAVGENHASVTSIKRMMKKYKAEEFYD